MTVAATTKDKGELTLSFQAFPQDGVLVVGLGNPLHSTQFMELNVEQTRDMMDVLSAEAEILLHTNSEESK